MFNNDLFMREIENLSKFLAKAVFHMDAVQNDFIDEQGNLLETNLLYHQLIKMVREGKINEAENILFEETGKNPDSEHLRIAIDFYRELGELSDDYLVSNGFSREEVMEGLNCITKTFKTSK